VIGSCSIGSKINDIIKHTPSELDPLIASNDSLSESTTSSSTTALSPHLAPKSDFYSRIFEKLVIDWEIPPGSKLISSFPLYHFLILWVKSDSDPEIVVTQRPKAPIATWHRGEEKNIRVDMPTDEQVIYIFHLFRVIRNNVFDYSCVNTIVECSIGGLLDCLELLLLLFD